MELFLGIPIWLLFGILGAWIATTKGRSGCGWFLLCSILGPFGQPVTEPQEGVLYHVAGGVLVLQQPGGEPRQPALVLLEYREHPTPPLARRCAGHLAS